MTTNYAISSTTPNVSTMNGDKNNHSTFTRIPGYIEVPPCSDVFPITPKPAKDPEKMSFQEIMFAKHYTTDSKYSAMSSYDKSIALHMQSQEILSSREKCKVYLSTIKKQQDQIIQLTIRLNQVLQEQINNQTEISTLKKEGTVRDRTYFFELDKLKKEIEALQRENDSQKTDIQTLNNTILDACQKFESSTGISVSISLPPLSLPSVRILKLQPIPNDSGIGEYCETCKRKFRRPYYRSKLKRLSPQTIVAHGMTEIQKQSIQENPNVEETIVKSRTAYPCKRKKRKHTPEQEEVEEKRSIDSSGKDQQHVQQQQQQQQYDVIQSNTSNDVNPNNRFTGTITDSCVSSKTIVTLDFTPENIGFEDLMRDLDIPF